MKFDTLELRDWCAGVLIDGGLPLADIRVMAQYHAETLAHHILAVVRLPVKVLQDDRVIAQWPTGLWDYIKRAIGLKYSTTQCHLTEHLVFPDIAVPPYGVKSMRVAVQSRISYGDNG